MYSMFNREPVQSWQNQGNIWLYFLVLVRTLAAVLAAVFWTSWSLFINFAEQPPSKALQ